MPGHYTPQEEEKILLEIIPTSQCDADGRKKDHTLSAGELGEGVPRPGSPYCTFSCPGGGCSTRMLQEMSGMGSASSRDTHTTDCSFPVGGRNPTFCQGERVCHRGPGCLPALPPLPRLGGGQLPQHWAFFPSRGYGMNSHCVLVYSEVLTHPALASGLCSLPMLW